METYSREAHPGTSSHNKQLTANAETKARPLRAHRSRILAVETASELPTGSEQLHLMTPP
jgi:hypothetical protein